MLCVCAAQRLSACPCRGCDCPSLSLSPLLRARDPSWKRCHRAEPGTRHWRPAPLTCQSTGVRFLLSCLSCLVCRLVAPTLGRFHCLCGLCGPTLVCCAAVGVLCVCCCSCFIFSMHREAMTMTMHREAMTVTKRQGVKAM